MSDHACAYAAGFDERKSVEDACERGDEGETPVRETSVTEVSRSKANGADEESGRFAAKATSNKLL